MLSLAAGQQEGIESYRYDILTFFANNDQEEDEAAPAVVHEEGNNRFAAVVLRAIEYYEEGTA